MRTLFCELNHFVLDARAIARSHSFDDPGEERGFIEVRSDDFVSVGVCMRDPAGNLPRLEGISLPLIEREDVVFSAENSVRKKAEQRRRIVPVLAIALRVVDALPQKSAWRPRFEASDLKTKFAQAVAQRRDSITHATAGLIAQSDMEQAAHECPGGYDDCARPKAHAEIGFHACRDVVFYEQPRDIALLEIEVRLFLENGLHAELIRFLVTLGSRRADAWPFPCIEHPELDAGGIRIESHGASKRVDLAHHVALCESAHRGVARHLANGVGVLSEHQCFAAKPRRCHCRFDSRMARADDDHVIGFGIVKLSHVKVRSRSSGSEASLASRDEPP